MSRTQKNREIAISSPLGADVLLFHRMHGSEQLGRLSEYRLELLSERNDILIQDVLGKSMSIRLDLPSGEKRYFNGIVTKFCSTGWHGNLCTYEATIHPWLWLLTRSSNCRIFQDKSAVEIVKEICHDPVYAGMIDLDVGLLSSQYEALPYCVQYRETDFHFVCRLMEHAGIYFFFKHTAARHTMVLADSYGAHAKIPGYGKVKFTTDGNRQNFVDESIHFWSSGGEIQASHCVFNDFDFERPAASTSGGLLVQATLPAAFDQPTYERFDYPGGYVKSQIGKELARARIEQIHGQCVQICADTNARGLFPGGLFGLAEHPRDDQNREYLITKARYELTSDAYETTTSSGSELSFRCEFSAIGKEHAYRPERITPKPFVQGPQTAMVVGKSGEEIWTDQYGRVKVQFHWDRLGKEDEKSSCWVRVAQSWAGKRWGTLFIPRIGMEVVVDFLEGDPDRPLITGCVYNAETMPPYPLPAEQTKSMIKSHSSKGGEGFNELRFEDKKGEEEIFIQAEKDFHRIVKNNDTLKVGFEKKEAGDQSIEIKNDQKLDIGHDQKVHVANSQTVDIDQDQMVHIKNNQKLDIDNNQKVHIGNSCVIEAASSIELKVGASSIKIEPAKITLKSTQISIEGNANVEVKSGAAMKLDSGATMAIKSGAIMTIEGMLVKIN